MKKLLLTISTCSALLFSACSSGGGGGGDSEVQSNSSLSLEVRQAQSTTDSSGVANFTVVVPERASAMQLVGDAAIDGTIRLSAISNAAGVNIIENTSEVGPFLNREFASPLVVNVPYAGGELSAGTYHVQLQLTPRRNKDDESAAGVAVTLRAYIKQDANLASGTMKINLVYLGPVADAEEIRDAVKESISVMRQIYSRAGISLDLQEYDYAGPATVQSAADGNAVYSAISTALRPQAVNLVLATDLRGLAGQGSGDDYGEAGGEPGSVIAGPKSAVSISILNVTGGDGRFDYRGVEGGSQESNDEKRLLGEEMVRLSANYAGLANIVEIRGSRVISSDTIGDSPACISIDDCQEDSSARTNVMMPIPLVKRRQDRDPSDGSTREYYPRDQFTAGQAAVLNSSIFVD